jgi:hypothetical protein
VIKYDGIDDVELESLFEVLEFEVMVELLPLDEEREKLEIDNSGPLHAVRIKASAAKLTTLNLLLKFILSPYCY